ncbi:hypothetical protein BVRB_8g190610 [Beta vulgaris subsp. vulgaris]|nr:hypothetical protein BVRB_8g190610 [Beta vulgaris subsp. vulgaris]
MLKKLLENLIYCSVKFRLNFTEVLTSLAHQKAL